MRIRTNQFAISMILTTTILLSPLTLAAQGSQGSNSDWSRINSVTSGSKLEVKQKDGKTVAGKLSAVSDTTLSLTVKAKPVDLKRDDVRSVYQLKAKSAKNATLIGLGVGAGVGAVIGLAGRNDNGFDKIENAAIAGLTVLGAGAGALTGYLIGKGARKRVLIYEAK